MTDLKEAQEYVEAIIRANCGGKLPSTKFGVDPEGEVRHGDGARISDDFHLSKKQIEVLETLLPKPLKAYNYFLLEGALEFITEEK